MRIEKQFTLASPRERVWEALGDAQFVAQCLPGAAITADLGDNRYKARFSVKLGPLAASFDGDVEIARNPDEWTAIVSGKGADMRTSSRASGSMTYRLSAPTASTTTVAVVSEINLAGALAQFGKTGVIEEVASRLTAEFVRNFEARMAAAGAPTQAAADTPAGTGSTAAPALNAGALLWSIIRDKLRALLGRIWRNARQ